MKIAFLGLGVMGFPMAGHLAQKKNQVTVFNRTEPKMEQWLSQHQGRRSLSGIEAVQEQEIVCTCLGGDSDLQSVLIEGHLIEQMAEGSLLIDHTTASPEMAKQLNQRCHSRGISFLDAPISGGQIGAEQGILSIMVGGLEKDFNRALPILECYGKNIVRIGEVGSGQTAKIINQICIASTIQGLAEGFAFGMRAGVDLEKVLSIISKGAAQSWQMEQRGPTMLEGEYDFGFAVKWMVKDLKIALLESEKVDADLSITKQILDRYETLMKNGRENLDTSSLLKLTQP